MISDVWERGKTLPMPHAEWRECDSSWLMAIEFDLIGNLFKNRSSYAPEDILYLFFSSTEYINRSLVMRNINCWTWCERHQRQVGFMRKYRKCIKIAWIVVTQHESPSGYPLHELTQEISDSSAAGPRPTPNSMEPSCPDFIGLHVQILSVFMLASPVPT